MPPNCPGCGASIGTPEFGRHIFGCGYDGKYTDTGKSGKKSKWGVRQQSKILETAVENIGLDKSKAKELLDEIWRLIR